MTTTLSVRIDTDTKKRLEALARRARRSKSFLAAEAIAAYVEAESWQLDEIQVGLEELNEGRAVDHKEVAKWLRSWGSKRERKSSSPVTIVWSPRALSHLEDLRAYIAHDSPTAASRLAASLLTAVERLADMPNLGRPGRVSGTRELVVAGTPYLIAYRVRSNRVEIIGVFHGRQKWPKRL